MNHIKTPIDVFPHWAQTDIVDADGTVLVSRASGHEGEMIAGEIKRALNERDKLIAQRDNLIAQRDALVAVLADIFSDVGTGSDLDWHLRISGLAVDIEAALALVKSNEATE